jgi:hypothetical protein
LAVLGKKEYQHIYQIINFPPVLRNRLLTLLTTIPTPLRPLSRNPKTQGIFKEIPVNWLKNT